MRVGSGPAAAAPWPMHLARDSPTTATTRPRRRRPRPALRTSCTPHSLPPSVAPWRSRRPLLARRRRPDALGPTPGRLFWTCRGNVYQNVSEQSRGLPLARAMFPASPSRKDVVVSINTGNGYRICLNSVMSTRQQRQARARRSARSRARPASRSPPCRASSTSDRVSPTETRGRRDARRPRPRLHARTAAHARSPAVAPA